MRRIQTVFGLCCLLATGTAAVGQAEAADEWSGGYAGINAGYGSGPISGTLPLLNFSIGSADASGGAIGAQGDTISRRERGSLAFNSPLTGLFLAAVTCSSTVAALPIG